MNKPVAVENKEVYSQFDVSVQKVIEGKEFGGERALLDRKSTRLNSSHL